MDQESSRGAEIITRLMTLVERYMTETVAQQAALEMLSEFWPGDEELDWHVLVDQNKTRIAQGIHEKTELLQNMLLEELSQGHLQHFEEGEKIAQRLVDSVENIDRLE
jgi:hypothetical protein